MPRGGARVGAGRKPKDKASALMHGSRERSVVRFPVASGASAAVSDVETGVAVPVWLEEDAVAVWAELAPLAAQERTLTVGTAGAFAMLCRAVALERKLAGASATQGTADHRGMMQRVEAGMRGFKLAPIGKPLAPAKEPEQSKVDRFRSAKVGG